VRKSARDKGVAVDLAVALGLGDGQRIRYSHRAPSLRLLTADRAYRQPKSWIFDPYLITLQSEVPHGHP
jgi:hypothetical protein